MSVSLASARYRAARDVTVEHHQLDWPTFARALRALRTLRNDVSTYGGTADLEALVERLWSWAYTLSGTPSAPGAAGTTTVRGAVLAHLDTGRDSRHGAVLAEIAAVLDQLCSELHPAASRLEDVVSRYGAERPGDPPAVYIASRQDDIGVIARWLKEQELDAEVRTVTQLKSAPVRQAVVLLGPPARFYVSAWCPLPAAGRVGGWLLTAPPAPAVHVITWPGHTGFNTGDAPLLPASARPNVTVSRVRVAAPGIAAAAPAEPVWLPPLPVQAEIAVGAWAQDREPVKATGLRLAGGYVAFFGPATGPRPGVVTWDLGAVDVANIEPGAVKAGQALLFHPDRSATDDELARRAGMLLTAKYGPGALGKALAAKQELKDALRRSKKSREQLVYELTSKLNDDQYARHIIHALRYPEYIAPEKQGAYPALRQVLGLPQDADNYRWLRALRGALRRAGHEVTNELVDVLTSTTSWQADLEAAGQVTIAGGEHLGCLELRVVTAVDPTQRTVGRSRLGRLLPDPSAASRGAL